MADERDEVDYPAWIMERAREGWGRAEIAHSMRLSLPQLKAWEESDDAIRRTMREAETAAQAWWEREQREALLDGGRVNAAAWRAAIEWRFGAPRKGASVQPSAPLARVNIPDNGRARRRTGAGRRTRTKS